ncbi:MAG: flavin-dependent oxidoreductase [Ardenticatenales bacterium]|nr:flavin-dependent oxidoreductase [Ardenticatenales bacterium]
MTLAQEPVIIAGAGPGGLSLALLLHQRGIPFRVYEAVQELKPLGVGINLLPHSVRVFHDLGVMDTLLAHGVETGTLLFCNKFGQHIKAEPRGKRAGYKYPQISIHRGFLQMILYRALVQRAGGGVVQTGHALESWQDEADGVTVALRTAAGEAVTVTGRCLIAADGIKSTARQRLYPDEGPPLYSGNLLWRFTTLQPPYLDGRTMVMAGHYKQKLVCYPITNADDDGVALINWIAELYRPDWQQLDQNWINQVSKELFCAPYASWKFDWLDVPGAIDNAEIIYEYPMTDRDPLPQWTFGHMTLLGDAAHPMYPIGSNGASQAVLDAETLANELASGKPLPAALASYEAERRPATAKIVQANRKEGPDIILEIAEERAPEGFTNIAEVISEYELEVISSRYKQTAGFDVKQVNR